MKLNLYDGTRTPRLGGFLLNVLLEISDYRYNLKITKMPGQLDLDNYNLIKKLSEQCRSGNKVNLDRLIDALEKIPEIKKNPERRNIILLEDDLCADAVNWCFGAFTEQNGLKYLIASSARVVDDTHLTHILAHETGHMFGAPSKGRSHTVNLLGLHCTNADCVMQQRTSIEESVKYAHRREGLPFYCYQCKEDIQR